MTDGALNLERVNLLTRIQRLEFLVQHLDKELAKVIERVERMSKPSSEWRIPG